MSSAAKLLVSTDDFGPTLSRTRQWLDLNRIEPENFRYDLGEPAVSVTVAFRSASQAAAFATAFGGQLVAEPAPGSFSPSMTPASSTARARAG